MEIEFKLIEKANIKIILPLLQELDPLIPKPVLQARLLEMVSKGYECLGIYRDNKLIGICGIWTLVKYYVGRHLELDNVYIKAKYRNQSIGNQLDAWLKNHALSRGCKAVELNCYIDNEQGRHFWEANEYIPIGLHYQKKLNKP